MTFFRAIRGVQGEMVDNPAFGGHDRSWASRRRLDLIVSPLAAKTAVRAVFPAVNSSGPCLPAKKPAAHPVGAEGRPAV